MNISLFKTNSSSLPPYIYIFYTKTTNRAENKIFHIKFFLNIGWHLQLQGLNFICVYCYITSAFSLHHAWTFLLDNYFGTQLEDSESHCGVMTSLEFIHLEATWFSCVNLGLVGLLRSFYAEENRIILITSNSYMILTVFFFVE